MGKLAKEKAVRWESFLLYCKTSCGFWTIAIQKNETETFQSLLKVERKQHFPTPWTAEFRPSLQISTLWPESGTYLGFSKQAVKSVSLIVPILTQWFLQYGATPISSNNIHVLTQDVGHFVLLLITLKVSLLSSSHSQESNILRGVLLRTEIPFWIS